MVAYPCGVCYNPVAINHRGIYCNFCRFWVHAKCNNSSSSDYHKLLDSDANDTWLCQKCFKKEAVFDSLTDEGLKLTLQGKSCDHLLFSDPENNLNVQFFKDIDLALGDTEMGLDIQCPYLSVSEQNKQAEKLSKNCLSIFHMNIASLELHKQNLINIINCSLHL